MKTIYIITAVAGYLITVYFLFKNIISPCEGDRYELDEFERKISET